MAPTKQELSLLINPLVPESVQHNYQVLTSLHSLTSFLLGLTAGILALKSWVGFLFYLVGTIVVSALFHLLRVGVGARSVCTSKSTSTSKSKSTSAVHKGKSGCSRFAASGAGVYFPGASGEIEGVDDRGFVRGASGGGSGVVRKGAWRDVWFGGGVLGEALSGFVLGWAGVGGVLR